MNAVRRNLSPVQKLWLCAVDSGFGFFVVGRECGWECQWASLRLSPCLGDALGVRGGPLPFLSIFPFVARLLIPSLGYSASHLSIAVFGFCFTCHLFLGSEEDYQLVTRSGRYLIIMCMILFVNKCQIGFYTILTVSTHFKVVCNIVILF